MTSVLVFSGVGSVSAETAQVMEKMLGVEHVDAVAERLEQEHGVQLREVLQRVRTAPESLTALEEIVAQLVVQLGAAQIARSALGPEAEIVVVGHSIGELAAAVVAGHLSPAEAVDAAVCLAHVTGSEQGGLVYGTLGPQDQVASLNHVDEDGADVGAAIILGDEAAIEADSRSKVHTGFPWHASVYESHEWRKLPARPAGSADGKNLPLALSLLGGFGNDEENMTLFDDEYWARWTHTGVDLAKTLAAVQERCAGKIARVVELGAHPILAPSLRRAFGPDSPAPRAMVDRQRGLHLDAWREIVGATQGAGVLAALREAFPVALDMDATWLESGLASADIVQGAAKLHRSGVFVGLKAHDFYRHVTPQDLIERFGEVAGAKTAEGTSAAAESASESAISASGARPRVVIRAMSCLLPANIKSPAQLFAFTSSQGDAVRFDAGFDGGKRAAAFLGDLTLDCAKFGISQGEAQTLDPQQALVLSCVDKLLTEHGIEQLPVRTGVYIGAWNSEFAGDRSSVFYPTGTNPSIIAARVSHVYRLHGPCKVINSACASSLDAVLEAQRDLAAGTIDAAIAGGVNLLWDPAFSTCMAQSGFLAPGARCRSFDSSADGYVRSEGAALVLLQRREPKNSDALNGSDAGKVNNDDCEPYYAEVLGGASNQNGGRGASLTAPSPAAQEECIAAALRAARVDAGEVDFVECHGTGTKLGDPIEWSALKAAVGTSRSADRPCYLASVKSSLGHLEAAAGVAGLLHAAMVLSRQEVPRMANFVEANPLLEPCEGLRLAADANVRPDQPLRVAGVSSFGFGGSNVHILLRAAPQQLLPKPLPPVAAPAKERNSNSKVFVFDRTQQRAQILEQQQQMQQMQKLQRMQLQHEPAQQVSSAAHEDASMQQTVMEQIFWDVVSSVAGQVSPEAQILQSGVDSLGLTELFLRIEQKMAVEASSLSDFLGGGYTWADLREKIMQSAKIAPSEISRAQATAAPTPVPAVAPQAKRQSARAPESEREDSVPDAFTWAVPRFDGLIRTTHVGSLPRPREPEQQYKELHKIIQTQLSIGISIINDGEAGRMDYVTSALTRMSGFEEQDESVAPQPLDLEDLPCLARRFLVRAGLITLNKSVRTCNPHCIGEVTYTGQKALERELQTVQRAMRLCNAGLPGQAFYSAPSPGTLAMFFNNDAPEVYPTYEEYLGAVADAMHVEYATIVRHGFTLQVDCPDLAMSRHTRFKHLGLMAWKRIARMHVKMLNRALEGIPREAVRVHVCWGNYPGTHHRDVSAREVMPIAFGINAGGFGFETANHRHNADAGALLDVDIPKDVDLYPGVIDTCSSSVEDPSVVCERICRYARVVGPERVIAGTDCGFSTTAETQGIPGQVAMLKMRALVAGARMASRAFFPKVVPGFVLRPARRRFYFAQEASAKVLDAVQPDPADGGSEETRIVLTGHLDPEQDAARFAAHVRLFVDVPVRFATDGSAQSEDFVKRVKAYLADGKRRNSPAYPVEDDEAVGLLTKEDMVVSTSGAPRDSYEVVVVGAGVVGLLAAKRLMDEGVDVVVLEKEEFCGGIWTTFANAKSQVNSSEGSYRVVHDYRSRPNRDHSTTAEVRADILKLARELNAQGRLFTSTRVANVERSGASGSSYTVSLEKSGAKITATGVILAINDRVGTPRPIVWKQHEVFSGQIVDGFGGDAENKNIDWAGKRVVVVGMGAFAVENARTALEHGAKNVVVLARRHGTICPKYIDYINFVHRASVDDIGDEMNATHNSKNMFLWRQLYASSNSTMPECWLDLIKHTGHTISVSDVWFVGHFLGKLETCVGEIDHFVENGVVVRGGSADDVIEADIVVRCTGFERNASLVPDLTPYTHMNAINYLDTNVMYLADAFIDDDAFNSFFGSSVVEMSKFYVMVYLHFFKGNDAAILDSAELANNVDVQDRKWTDYIRGAEFLVDKVPGIREKANALLRSRRDDFVDSQSVEEYIAANRREWQELHDILSQGIIDESCALPYPDWKA
ncbi:Polyketide synthase [Hondaea fermentalgiana]|uniref:Polyketide synthase n=1 Tax=Hondaea fermentalgiana TaxID=2315210 RepID=A0A2R5G0I0_9STRA|nr:Polyketide synthase [Hondaea fermentalgiana]|eukprot:GBG23799.1 Polyketide synthase [Hondaea fermentalgiana]